MRVIILGAGPQLKDNETPVWLAEAHGEVLVERFVNACKSLGAKLIFAVRRQDVRRFHIDNVIKLASPDAAVVAIDGDTQGAPCTALLCVHLIDPEDELLILNSNEFLDIDYCAPVDDFRQRGLDAGVVTFRSLHPRYSYMLVDGNGLIVEAAEKRPISRHATAGFYWYRRGADFVQSAQDMIRKDAHVDNRFFISLTLNELVLKHKRMGIHEVEAKHYRPLKSQRQISLYEADIHPEAAPRIAPPARWR